MSLNNINTISVLTTEHEKFISWSRLLLTQSLWHYYFILASFFLSILVNALIHISGEMLINNLWVKVGVFCISLSLKNPTKHLHILNDF